MKLVTFIVSDDEAEDVRLAWEGGYPIKFTVDFRPDDEKVKIVPTLDSIKEL